MDLKRYEKVDKNKSNPQLILFYMLVRKYGPHKTNCNAI